MRAPFSVEGEKREGPAITTTGLDRAAMTGERREKGELLLGRLGKRKREEVPHPEKNRRRPAIANLSRGKKSVLQGGKSESTSGKEGPSSEGGKGSILSSITTREHRQVRGKGRESY